MTSTATPVVKPAMRPARAEFSSGPCAKRPGWAPKNLKSAVLGRSHRSKPGKARLKLAIDRTRDILGVPADYLIGIVPGSDTGAVEMAMWSMLGPKPVQLLAYESFGKDWATDVVKQLKLKDVEVLEALHSRCDANLAVLETWVARTPWADFLAADPATRSNTSVCLKVVDPKVTALAPADQEKLAKRLAALLEAEGVALDVGHYRDAPAGLRIWCGATVETEDLSALTPWLDWAFAQAVSELSPA